MKTWVVAAEDPFLFSIGIDQFTGDVVWGPKGLAEAFERVGTDSLEYHARRGDLSTWARESLADAALAEGIEAAEGLRGDALRAALLEAATEAVRRAGPIQEKGVELGRASPAAAPQLLGGTGRWRRSTGAGGRGDDLRSRPLSEELS